MIIEKLTMPTVIGFNDGLDEIMESFADIVDQLAFAVGYSASDSCRFETRAIEAGVSGAAKAPAIAEANMDALRLWCLPMRRGERPKAIGWAPKIDAGDVTGSSEDSGS
jgi:hypothetical protein